MTKKIMSYEVTGINCLLMFHMVLLPIQVGTLMGKDYFLRATNDQREQPNFPGLGVQNLKMGTTGIYF